MDYENANKALDKARAKNRDVLQAETSQQLCCHKFEKISESAKQGVIQILVVPADRVSAVCTGDVPIPSEISGWASARYMNLCIDIYIYIYIYISYN